MEKCLKITLLGENCHCPECSQEIDWETVPIESIGIDIICPKCQELLTIETHDLTLRVN